MKRRITITVECTLEFDDEKMPGDDDCDFVAIGTFIDGLPEKYGPVTLYSAEVIRGRVDRDGVPITSSGE